MNFFILPARVEFEAQDRLELPAGRESNLFRGAFGAALRQISCRDDCSGATACPLQNTCAYARLFAPRWPAGPSGYRDAPRPFVLRWQSTAHVAAPGDAFSADFILLDIHQPPWPLLEEAFASAARDGLGPARVRAKLTALQISDPLRLPLVGEPASGTLRLWFATPIELKESGIIVDEPRFPTLIQRLAERVRALGRLYQRWPRGWHYDNLILEAQAVQLVNWHWVRSDAFRRSSSNGHVHSIGGFTGWAEYSGPLGKFLPLLEIARWIGVGRQTVWGKGEIRLDEFARS